MSKLRILIVEDNYPFAIKIELNLVKWGYEVIGIVDNNQDALMIIDQFVPDLILLDIFLENGDNGIHLATESKLEIPIIYMTAEKDETIFELAQKTNGISYLVKPFNMLSLKGAIEFSKKLILKNRSSFKYIKSGKKLKQIDIDNLIFVQSERNYCDFITEQGKSTLRITLKRTLEQLPSKEFMRVHNQFIVRISKIQNIYLSKYKIKINDKLIPFGRSYKKKLLDKIQIIKRSDK